MSFFKTRYIQTEGDTLGRLHALMVYSMIFDREIIDYATYIGNVNPQNIKGFWEDFKCISYDIDEEFFDDALEFLKSIDGIYFSTFMNLGFDIYFENEDMIDIVNVYFSLVCGET